LPHTSFLYRRIWRTLTHFPVDETFVKKLIGILNPNVNAYWDSGDRLLVPAIMIKREGNGMMITEYGRGDGS
jgi:hypothetical protein